MQIYRLITTMECEVSSKILYKDIKSLIVIQQSLYLDQLLFWTILLTDLKEQNFFFVLRADLFPPPLIYLFIYYEYFTRIIYISDKSAINMCI